MANCSNQDHRYIADAFEATSAEAVDGFVDKFTHGANLPAGAISALKEELHIISQRKTALEQTVKHSSKLALLDAVQAMEGGQV